LRLAIVAEAVVLPDETAVRSTARLIDPVADAVLLLDAVRDLLATMVDTVVLVLVAATVRLLRRDKVAVELATPALTAVRDL
jgi:hypothetical protein